MTNVRREDGPVSQHGRGDAHPDGGLPQLNVPLVQMNALMGFVADAAPATILGLNLDRVAEVRTARAFNKLLWLQNDLINRHYATSAIADEAALSA